MAPPVTPYTRLVSLLRSGHMKVIASMGLVVFPVVGLMVLNSSISQPASKYLLYIREVITNRVDLPQRDGVALKHGFLAAPRYNAEKEPETIFEISRKARQAASASEEKSELN